MALATLTAVNAAFPGQRLDGAKTATSTSGRWRSMWLDAAVSGAGVAPSSGLSGDVPTKSTAGALPFVNPASGTTQVARIVSGYDVNGSASGGFLGVYDRLWHNSGVSATSTSAQTVNSVALTRPDANGAGAEAWWEVYVVMGAGTPTVTLAYTNSGGTGSRSGSSGALATTLAVGQTGPFTMQSGDVGVKSIQTWTSNATFTSGTIGLVIRRPVVLAPLLGGNAVTQLDAIGLCLPRVYDDACLETLIVPSSSNQFYLPFSLTLVQG